MKHMNDLDLDDPKVKEWMDTHFKANEYAILGIMVKAGTEAETKLLALLQTANLNMVIIPSMVVQVMINLKEINKLVDTLKGSEFNVQIPSKVQAMLDFASDEKKGQAQ
jgi:hypothetical protein